jgi:hypothetical protein
MSRYHQSDSLPPPATDIPLSGTGGSTPEATVGNADWQWEKILTTVLGISIPDRSALLGQPWLVITHDGATLQEAHQIWTGSWDSTPSGGPHSIRVYLSPSLYAAGGLWDQFRQAPLTALSGVPAGQYGTLPLQPPSFHVVELALAGVTGFYARAADAFSGLARHASARSTGFSGSVAQLFGKLGTIMLSPHDQSSTLVAYSAAVGQAGDAAARFLTALWTAYCGWAEQAAQSPLGAIGQLLAQIGEPEAVDTYQIADPQDTPYGDLATGQGWAEVEQQAKDRWLGLLTGETPGAAFSGLDPLGRAALSGLVSQYDSAIATLTPTVGPGIPAIRSRPFSAFANLPGPGVTS